MLIGDLIKQLIPSLYGFHGRKGNLLQESPKILHWGFPADPPRLFFSGNPQSASLTLPSLVGFFSAAGGVRCLKAVTEICCLCFCACLFMCEILSQWWKIDNYFSVSVPDGAELYIDLLYLR